MGSSRWRYFWIALATTIGAFAIAVFEQGGFEQIATKGALVILILAVVATGVAMYRYVSGLENPGDPLGASEKVSPSIRVICGILGVLGFAAIAYNASQANEVRPGIGLYTSFIVGFIFLFVSFFGKYPWDTSDSEDEDG